MPSKPNEKRKGRNQAVNGKLQNILEALASRIKEPRTGDLVTDLTGTQKPAVLLGITGYTEQEVNLTNYYWDATRVRVRTWKALRDGTVELEIREDHMKVIR